jgi:hypothetical protein
MADLVVVETAVHFMPAEQELLVKDFLEDQEVREAPMVAEVVVELVVLDQMLQQTHEVETAVLDYRLISVELSDIMPLAAEVEHIMDQQVAHKVWQAAAA